MTPFATTADIRSLDETSVFSFACRYALLFTAMLAVCWLISALVMKLPGPLIPATMAAYVGTQPKQRPRFRSWRRFLLSLAIGLVLAVGYVVIGRAFGFADTTIVHAVLQVSFYTIILGCVDAAMFLRTCLLTPGPEMRRSEL